MRLQWNTTILQASVPIREETFESRPHIVVPVVALIEGVHEGSSGAIFYPGREIAKFVGAWSGIPLPVFHPEEYGAIVSANNPEQLEERSVGRFFKPFFDPDGSKLKGELWIDVGKAEKISPETLRLIRSGQPLEISTALWFDNDGVSGWWSGEEFVGTARNFRPDHLALLPGGEGACSWADGCGVRANIKSAARTPSFDGTESTSWEGVKTSFRSYRDAYYRAKGNRPTDAPSRVQDAPVAMKNWIASKTLLGEGGADNERDLIFFPVVNPGTGKLNEGALRAVISGRGAQARIPAQAKASAQRKARSLLNKHFGAELEVSQAMDKKKSAVEKFKSLICSIGRSFGFEVGEELTVQEVSHDALRGKLQKLLDELDNRGWIHFVREVYDDIVIYEARGNNPSETGTPGGVAKLYRRGYSVDDENETVTLKDDVEEVREERKYIPVEAPSASAANKEVNKKQEEVKKVEQKEKIAALIACNETKFVEKDQEWLESLSIEQLEKLEALERKPPQVTPEEKEKLEKLEKEKLEKEKLEKEKKPEVNTVDGYIAKAPGEIQEVLRRAVDRDRFVKEELVKALMANERNKFSEEQLKLKDISELEILTELARIEVDFTGQIGGPVKKVDDDKVEKMPAVFNLSKSTEKASAGTDK